MANELKENIEKKFGNLGRFSLLTGMNYHKLYRMITGTEDDHKWLQDKIDSTLNTPIDGYDLTEEIKKTIRIKILTKYKTFNEFCQKNEGYFNYWISNVVNGRVAKMTPKIKKLCKELNIEIHE